MSPRIVSTFTSGPPERSSAWSTTTPALAQLTERVAALGPTLVALEATGGYEVTVAAALASAQLPGGGGQSAPNPGLRAGHWATGPDRCPRRARDCRLCRGDPPGRSGPAGRAGPHLG